MTNNPTNYSNQLIILVQKENSNFAFAECSMPITLRPVIKKSRVNWQKMTENWLNGSAGWARFIKFIKFDDFGASQIQFSYHKRDDFPIQLFLFKFLYKESL